jgi:uncharacterized protein YraI
MLDTRTLSRRQLLFASAGAAIMAFIPSRQAGATVDVFVVVTGPLNLRSGPGLQYNIIRSLPTGTALDVTNPAGSADGYTWVEVYVPSLNITGLVASEFIERRSYPDGSTFPVGANVVATGSLNVRSGASLSFPLIVTLWSGAPLTVTGAPVQAGGYTWYPIRTGYGTTGWVAGQFLSSGGVVSPEFPVGSNVETTTVLNLRSGAGLTYPVVVSLWQGAPLTVTGAPVAASGFTWYPVRTGYGTTGWVAGEYLV